MIGSLSPAEGKWMVTHRTPSLSVTECFTSMQNVLLAGGRIGEHLALARPVDADLRTGQFVVKDTVHFVRFVEGVVDQSVRDLAQTPPSGPGGLARIVGAEHSVASVPALGQKLQIHGTGCGSDGSRSLTFAMGTPASRGADQQTQFRFMSVVVVVAAVEVIIVIRLVRPIHFAQRIVTLNAIHFDDAAANGSHFRLVCSADSAIRQLDAPARYLR